MDTIRGERKGTASKKWAPHDIFQGNPPTQSSHPLALLMLREFRELYLDLWWLSRHIAADEISPGPMDLRLPQLYLAQSHTAYIFPKARCSIIFLVPTARYRCRNLWGLLAYQSKRCGWKTVKRKKSRQSYCPKAYGSWGYVATTHLTTSFQR